MAQIKPPVIFGGLDYFRDVDYQKNAYYNFNVGTQLLQYKFIAPEIGFSSYSGSVREISKLHPVDPNARAPSKLKTSFSTTSFSLAPKFIFGNEEAALVIIPQYNFGRIKARGDLLKDSGRNYYLEEQVKTSINNSFWSIAAGIEGQFTELELFYFSLFLKYTGLNSEEILSELQFENSTLRSVGGSAEGWGLGLRVYFDFLKLLKTNRS